MRPSLLIACLLTVGLTGCASREAALLPPGTSWDELNAAVAARGQDEAPDATAPTSRSSVVASCANGAALVAAGTGYVALELAKAAAQAGSNSVLHR